MLGRSTKGKREAPKKPRRRVSVTRVVFLSTQISALVWVSTSYGIAIYSTVALQQPFPVTELSSQAITSILGVGFLKVLENIFEHNDGPVFGHSKKGEQGYGGEQNYDDPGV